MALALVLALLVTLIYLNQRDSFLWMLALMILYDLSNVLTVIQIILIVLFTDSFLHYCDTTSLLFVPFRLLRHEKTFLFRVARAALNTTVLHQV